MKKVYTVLGVALLISAASTAAMASVTLAPEIDPASAGSAIALVSGMALLVRARRSK